jgi:single-stranded-DNA-specific exonuclease
MKKLTRDDIRDILLKRFEDDSYNSLAKLPHPTEFKDIIKATERIEKAINNKEKIFLVGDYDVDGIISTSVVLEFFEFINYDIEYVIPNRFEHGYGISIELIKDKNYDVIITVDNGVSAVEVGDYCQEHGIDLIITDHHLPPEQLPKAYAIINQKQKDCNFPIYEICGAQVAWYLIASLKNRLNVDFSLKAQLDLVSIAIISDVMPLNKINRTMTKEGLKLLNNTYRESIQIIKDKMSIKKITSETIGFFIAPKINSTGRLKDASLGVDFIRSKNKEQALSLFNQLEELNNQRKQIELDITQQAFNRVNQKDKVIVVWGENWHEGVVGIVASRLADKFKKPSIVLSITDKKAKGSARSIGNVNIYNILDKCKEHILGFGGHKKAGGLALKVDELESFKKSVNLVALDIKEEDFIEDEDITGEIFLNHIDLRLLDTLEKFEPYGEGNPKLTFFMNKVKVQNFRRMGKNNEHIRFSIIDKRQNINLTCLKFRSDDDIRENQIVSFTYKLVKNEFRGTFSVQIMIEEFKETN